MFITDCLPTLAEALRLVSAFGIIVGIAVLLGGLSAVVEHLAEREERLQAISEEQAERRRFQAVTAERGIR